MLKKSISRSFFLALGEGAYIFLIALLFQNGDKIFGNKPGILGFITLLLLLVVSVAVSGALILGKPVLLYMEGKKREAVELFLFTLGWLFVFLTAVLAIVALAVPEAQL